MSDSLTQLKEASKKAARGANDFVMFTALHPVGLRGWLRPYRYELHMTAIASSLEEVEEFKTWQLRSKYWRPSKPHRWMDREVAFLFAPIIPALRDTEHLKQYLVMQYILPFFTGYPRGSGWDAVVVWAENETESYKIADDAGLTPMRKPIAAISAPVPGLATVKDILGRLGIVYM